MSIQTIIQKFESQEIAFDLFRGDLMVNATEMAKPFRKRVDVYLKTKQTKALIEALIEDRISESNYHQLVVVESEILTTKEGQHGGTFMCEDLALAFAMWLSPDFHVWVLKTVREIIFGDNPELVREAIVNMPRIQTNLKRMRRKRQRLKAILLGPERRKEMNELLSKRSAVVYQLNAIVNHEGKNSLFADPTRLGQEILRLINERDAISDEIHSMEQDHSKLLIKEEYIELCKEISLLEREQRHYSKVVRYSERLNLN